MDQENKNTTQAQPINLGKGIRYKNADSLVIPDIRLDLQDHLSVWKDCLLKTEVYGFKKLIDPTVQERRK